jgi:Zn-dependent protease with chaperone function
MEYLADHDAATITRDPMGLASALQNIDSTSRPWWKSVSQVSYQSSDWLSSHPNTLKRIEKLQAMSHQYAYHDTEKMYGAHLVDHVMKTRPYFWL